MRLLFLCSALEPGRDGVGDHIRLLGEALAAQGIECAFVALNDRHVEEPQETSDSLRLPAQMDWRARVARASAFRARFLPDWISLHLVPYGFQSKGLLGDLIPGFAQLTQGCRLHVMLHELWLGAGVDSSWRHRLIGSFQRRGVVQLLKAIHFNAITTSNPVYVAMLREEGISATVLPLFGNVPIEKSAPGNAAAPLRLESGAAMDPDQRGDWWMAIFFGGLYPEWQPAPLMSMLKRVAETHQKRLLFVLAGRAGAGGDVLWNKLEQDYGAWAAFKRAGELSTHDLSMLFQAADFGIAASPWQLIGKSGSVASMLEHGLPVIVPRDDFHPKVAASGPPSVDPLLHRFDVSLEAKLQEGLFKRPATSRLPAVAAELLKILQASSQ